MCHSSEVDRENKMDWCTWPIQLAQRLTPEASTPQAGPSVD